MPNFKDWLAGRPTTALDDPLRFITTDNNAVTWLAIRTALAAIITPTAPLARKQGGISVTATEADKYGTVIASEGTSLVTVSIPANLSAGWRCAFYSRSAGGLTVSLHGGATTVGSPNLTIANGDAIYVERTADTENFVIWGAGAA